jgi:quercetin dioxygenase-like cupin family protein
MGQHLLGWTDVPEQESAAGVSKRVIDGVDAALIMVRVAAGISAPKHSHSHEQFVQVISGEGLLETEQGARKFGPGSVFHFPQNTWHAARFDTETVLIETNLKARTALHAG